MIIRKLYLTFFCLAFHISCAEAQVYHPDFSCSADLSNNITATMLCKNSDAAKSELQFDQAYYALRHKVGKHGWKGLKEKAVSDQSLFGNCIDPSDGEASPSCYISHMHDLTEDYRGKLSGDALEEATRPIDQHIQLQQKLIDLGYLPAGSVADGVYGEGTRTAIETWQRVTHRPFVDGFLSNDDAMALEQNGIPLQNTQNPTAPVIASSTKSFHAQTEGKPTKECYMLSDEDFRSTSAKIGSCVGLLSFPSLWRYDVVTNDILVLYDQDNRPIAIYENVDLTKIHQQYIVNTKKLKSDIVHTRIGFVKLPVYYITQYIGKFQQQNTDDPNYETDEIHNSSDRKEDKAEHNNEFLGYAVGGYIFIWALGLLSLYFIPTTISIKRNTDNKFLVFTVNFCLGWTVVGWLGALIMACTFEKKR